MATRPDYKRAAVEQWTADPCNAHRAEGEPGTRPYFKQLLRTRSAYAPWMAEVLDYQGAAGAAVLDVGCGQGIDLARYAMAGARPTGVDLTPRHVELAGAHLAAMELEGEVLQGDAEALPLGDRTFARVSSNGVLHHTPDMPAALGEVHRVLEPGGTARIIVYNRDSLHYWLNKVLLEGIAQGGLRREGSMEGVLTRVEHSSIDARPLVRVFSARQMRGLMRAAGFDGVRTIVRGFHASDSFVTAALDARLGALADPAVRDRIGRVAGWYVIAYGTRTQP